MSFAAALAGAAPQGLRFGHRVAVYRNNVAAALVNALAVRYPATRRLVGGEFFAAMAGEFALAHLPASPVLIHYGADFPAFVAGFAPASGLPYLASVAGLESAWWQAYHAADAAAVEPAAFAALSPDQLDTVRLAFHPATALVASPCAAHSIWRRQRGDGSLAGLDLARPELALVARSGADVAVTAVDADFAAFLQLLLSGASLAEAGAAVSDLAEALTRLIAARIVTDLSC